MTNNYNKLGSWGSRYLQSVFENFEQTSGCCYQYKNVYTSVVLLRVFRQSVGTAVFSQNKFTNFKLMKIYD